MDWETKAALAGLADLGLDVSDANCRRWWRAVDIEANRLTLVDVPSTCLQACAEVNSDSRDLVWRVWVSEDQTCCGCGCEDKYRHDGMAKSFNDQSNRHFCKHAIALLMRVKEGDTECGLQEANGNLLQEWLTRSKKLIKGIDDLLSPEDLHQLSEQSCFLS